MFFIIYKTTNKINGKCYVGSHKTDNIEDGYLGSGKYLKAAIKKHGPENFVREILFQFNNPDDMYAKEAEIVNEDFLMNENTYNLKVGGYGGFDHINRDEVSRRIKNQKARKTTNKIIFEKYGITNPSQLPENRKRAGERMKLLHKEGKVKAPSWLGKSHTKETLEKMRLSQKGKQVGSKNSQYGKRWVNNGVEEIKLSKEDSKPDNWNYGRLKIKI